ncbi:hypothetical protein PENSUB_10934 [Penicillium subrubescens]|uniref:Uncharacterized protein n=1 Tax=Penicillium subrubescens TaxID=1316194 RepID=A0A1Q5T6R5_9EURO|nr:hypothetical protein PENSUB_10934 [Penicillium subrubescens]
MHDPMYSDLDGVGDYSSDGETPSYSEISATDIEPLDICVEELTRSRCAGGCILATCQTAPINPANKLAVQVTQKPTTWNWQISLPWPSTSVTTPRLFEYVVVHNILCDIVTILWSMETNEYPFLRDVANFFKGRDNVDSMVNALTDVYMREVFYGFQLQVLKF